MQPSWRGAWEIGRLTLDLKQYPASAQCVLLRVWLLFKGAHLFVVLKGTRKGQPKFMGGPERQHPPPPDFACRSVCIAPTFGGPKQGRGLPNPIDQPHSKTTSNTHKSTGKPIPLKKGGGQILLLKSSLQLQYCLLLLDFQRVGKIARTIAPPACWLSLWDFNGFGNAPGIFYQTWVIPSYLKEHQDG